MPMIIPRRTLGTVATTIRTGMWPEPFVFSLGAGLALGAGTASDGDEDGVGYGFGTALVWPTFLFCERKLKSLNKWGMVFYELGVDDGKHAVRIALWRMTSPRNVVDTVIPFTLVDTTAFLSLEAVGSLLCARSLHCAGQSRAMNQSPRRADTSFSTMRLLVKEKPAVHTSK